jgi:hypothetical protein
MTEGWQEKRMSWNLKGREGGDLKRRWQVLLSSFDIHTSFMALKKPQTIKLSLLKIINL